MSEWTKNRGIGSLLRDAIGSSILLLGLRIMSEEGVAEVRRRILEDA